MVLVVLGLVFLLRNMHLLPLPSVFFSWKALLMVIGVIGISLGRKEGLIPLIIGALFIFIYDILGLHYFSFRDLWPIALVLVGIALLMRHRRSNQSTDDDPEIDAMAIFSGVEKHISSDAFEGGKATAIFGGIDLDMKTTTLSPKSSTIDLITMFGGAVFKIPPDWTVNVSQLTVVFGAFEDHRVIDQSNTDPNKVLHIKGLILFGGGEIKNA